MREDNTVQSSVSLCCFV